MVTVKLLTCLSGPEHTWDAGDEYSCSAEEAARLIEAGFAEAVAPKVEKAVAPAPAAKRGKQGGA